MLVLFHSIRFMSHIGNTSSVTLSEAPVTLCQPGFDTLEMCVMYLVLKHSQAAFESLEECSLKVFRHHLACLMNFSGGEPVVASITMFQEPMDLTGLLVYGPGSSWNNHLNLTVLPPWEMAAPDPGVVSLEAPA